MTESSRYKVLTKLLMTESQKDPGVASGAQGPVVFRGVRKGPSLAQIKDGTSSFKIVSNNASQTGNLLKRPIAKCKVIKGSNILKLPLVSKRIKEDDALQIYVPETDATEETAEQKMSYANNVVYINTNKTKRSRSNIVTAPKTPRRESVPSLPRSEQLHMYDGSLCSSTFTNFTFSGFDKLLCPASTFVCSDGRTVVRTMDNLINLIGRSNYSGLMCALNLISDETLRKKAIAGLMTAQIDGTTKTNNDTFVSPKVFKEAAVMTDFQMKDIFPEISSTQRKMSSRKRQRPYVAERGHKMVRVQKTIIDPFSYCPQVNDVISSDSNSLDNPGKYVPDTQSEIDNLSDVTNIISKAASLDSFDITPSIINNHEDLAHKLAERFTKTEPPDDETLFASSDDFPQQRELFDVKISNKVLEPTNNNIQETRKTCNENITELNRNRRSSFVKSEKGLSESDNPMEDTGEILLERSQVENEAVDGTWDMDVSENARDALDYVTMWNRLSASDRALMQGVKPEDCFHLVTPERLKTLSQDDRKKLLDLQMYIDWKYCLEADADNNLPIHTAVLNNDLDLLMRQCFVLKAHKQSIDIGDANFNYSALQMCVARGADAALARALLRLGASPLAADDEERSALHLAAEAPSHEYVELLLEHMAANSSYVLKEEQLWRPELEDTPQQLVNTLFGHALTAFDGHGYTPLMLAARLGHAEHVYCMLERLTGGADVVNVQAPNSGNTAVYLAVEAACHRADKTGDKSKIADNYSRTIENLIRYGADPWIENKYGASVNSLICEYDISSLNTLINNTLGQSKMRPGSVVYNYMISTADGKEKQVTCEDTTKPFILIKTADGLFYEDSMKKSNVGSLRFVPLENLNKADSNKTVSRFMISGVDKSHNGDAGKKTKRLFRSRSITKKGEELPQSNVTVIKCIEPVAKSKDIDTENVTKNKIVTESNDCRVKVSAATTSTPPAKSNLVILQNIALSSTSDYIKNCNVKPIKVKVLDRKKVSPILTKHQVTQKNIVPSNLGHLGRFEEAKKSIANRKIPILRLKNNTVAADQNYKEITECFIPNKAVTKSGRNTSLAIETNTNIEVTGLENTVRETINKALAKAITDQKKKDEDKGEITLNSEVLISKATNLINNA